jgi:predicted SAM-dependent methyltransferase
MKLNLGCGGRPLCGYINVDRDNIQQLKIRYPTQKFSENIEIFDWDIFNLPLNDDCADEVLMDSVLEHVSFIDEPRILREAHRVLKPGGKLIVTVPDFEATCRAWLAAEDDWQEFFDDSEHAINTCHWFGTHSYSYENRWGYLMATFYGSQNGDGQFHRNGYSKGKLKKMLTYLGFQRTVISEFRWKGDRDFMLKAETFK